MRRIFLLAAAAVLTASAAQAENITLTMTAAAPGGSTDVAAKNLAEVAAAEGIATIQVQVGQTLTKTVQQVAEGKTDISATPFILNFLLSKGLGPYAALGKKKGKELADNLRLLYGYNLSTFYLFAYKSTGIKSWDDIKGKTIFNGPPRGGALVSARQIIQATTGLKEGKDYTGKQIAWGQADSIFLDGSVEAAVRPGMHPAAFMPILLAAGDINMISVPKAIFEGAGWKKVLNAPGRIPMVLPGKEFDQYGGGVHLISEDGVFRSAAEIGGDMVNKRMDKKLAKALTAAFIKSVPELKKKVPFAKSALYGVISDEELRMCRAGVKLHPGAIEAWEEAGHKIADCAKPKS
jgi:TRAP-type uncharacterized transport system substrate-binding protein